MSDCNRDGKADLAVANYDSSSISILLGNGDGTFATAVSYSPGTNPQSVVAGTRMPFAGMPAATDRADLIAYLESP